MLSKRQRRLYGYIARKYEDVGAVPTLSEICHDLKMSTVEASNVLWLLVDVGYLSAPQKVNRYRYLWNTARPRIPLQRRYFTWNDQDQRLEPIGSEVFLPD
jgi:hypothetical protein